MLGRLLLTYPKARSWVAQTVHSHRGVAVPVLDFASVEMDAWISSRILSTTRVVVVDRVPRPPLEAWNMHAADDFAFFSAAGLALDDTIFVRSDHEFDQSLLFHELVHIVQWWVLQQRGFLMIYGLLLLEDGYDEHPLERMAYELQDRFEIGIPFDAGPIIARRVQELAATFQRRSWLHRTVGMLLPPMRRL